MKKLLSFLSVLALVSTAPVWASPGEYYEYHYRDGYHHYRDGYYDGGWYYHKIRGRVDALDWNAGYIVINGQKFKLAQPVWFEYWRPEVGSYVEAKLRPEGNGFAVYRVEVKYR